MVWQAIGAALGSLGGYMYYKKIGCRSGACPLVSSPLGSLLYGGLLGFLIAGMILR